MREIVRAQYTGCWEPAQLVIRDTGEWEEFWARFMGNRIPLQGHTLPEAPEVDFGKEMLIAVAMGSRSNGGYSLAVTDVRVGPRLIEVVVREHSPRRGQIVTQAFVQPVHVVAVPASGLPVRFLVSAQESDVPGRSGSLRPPTGQPR